MLQLSVKSDAVMRAVDTNVLVRLFVNDEPKQTAAARQALAAGPTFVPKTVLLELEWVLRSLYGYASVAIASAIEDLISAPDADIEDETTVRRALGWFRQGIDFADALHLASSGHANAFITFDKAMRRRATTLGAEPTVTAL
jgi:predicted nucleic-acid-binding protein